MYNFYSVIPNSILIADFPTIIWRSIIDKDNLYVFKCLIRTTFYALFQKLLGYLVDWYNDRNCWSTHITFSYHNLYFCYLYLMLMECYFLFSFIILRFCI